MNTGLVAANAKRACFFGMISVRTGTGTCSNANSGDRHSNANFAGSGTASGSEKIKFVLHLQFAKLINPATKCARSLGRFLTRQRSGDRVKRGPGILVVFPLYSDGAPVVFH